MRRPLFMLPATTALAALAALTALGALGCEDGPAQTFSAAPPNAGNIWNNGNVAPDVADAGQAFDASYPTVDKTVLCSTDFKRQRWAWMLTQPIWPPRWYAGIDLAAGDQWPGLTIEAAEAPPSSPTADAGGLCQSVPQGFEGICPSGFGDCNGSYWGNNGEVSFSWNVSTHILDQMVINLGYTGVLATNAYPDHNGESHTWSLAIGDVVRRDGLPFEMNWNNSTDVNQQITDIFNGIMSTYALSAGVPFNTAACTTDTTCQAQAPGTISNCQCTKNAQGSCDTTIAGQRRQVRHHQLRQRRQLPRVQRRRHHHLRHPPDGRLHRGRVRRPAARAEHADAHLQLLLQVGAVLVPPPVDQARRRGPRRPGHPHRRRDRGDSASSSTGRPSPTSRRTASRCRTRPTRPPSTSPTSTR